MFAATNHEVSPHAGAETFALLAKRGYSPIELSNVLVQPIPELAQPRVNVRRCTYGCSATEAPRPAVAVYRAIGASGVVVTPRAPGPSTSANTAVRPGRGTPRRD